MAFIVYVVNYAYGRPEIKTLPKGSAIVSHQLILQQAATKINKNAPASSDVNATPEKASVAVSESTLSRLEPGFNTNINKSGLNIEMTSMHGSDGQFIGNNDADSEINIDDFSVLIESIGSGSVETDNLMDDSFALLSDFLSMRAANGADTSEFKCPKHLYGGGTDYKRLLLELNHCPVPDA